MTFSQCRKQLNALADPERAANSLRFFKTGKGEYGEGDMFLGLTVPQIRKLAKEFEYLPLRDVKKLLAQKEHEARLLALIILVNKFKKANVQLQGKIYTLYLRSTRHINNWDLVDTSAHQIMGAYLEGRPKHILQTLARSKSVWERRIAMIATFHFLKHGSYHETFRIAKILLNDSHDLIHKAVGWMLREVGKHFSHTVEEEFLQRHYTRMPRTMLRYAIEHFPDPLRKKYLKKG